MYNHIGVMGRLVSDPELKTTQSGTSVTSFRVAVERNYADKDGNRQADFFDVVAWRGTAEFVCRYFGKGSLVMVEGQLQSRTYQTKDGSNRYTVEIVASSVFFTGERRDNQTANNQPNNYGQQQYQQNGSNQQHPSQVPPAQYGPGYATNFDAPPLEDDDLPF